MSAALAGALGSVAAAAGLGRLLRGRAGDAEKLAGAFAWAFGGAGLASAWAAPLVATATGAAAAVAFAIAAFPAARWGGGWPDGRGWARGCGAALVGLLAAWLVAAGAAALGRPVEPQALLVALRAAPSAGPVLYALLGAPVSEELLFRGLLLPALAARWGFGPANAAQAALFGLLHAGDPQAVLPLVALGAALGWARMRSESVGPAVLGHALNNGLALALG